jgi:hypothetical protein
MIGLLLHNKFERMMMEAVVGSFELVLWNFPGSSEENLVFFQNNVSIGEGSNSNNKQD